MFKLFLLALLASGPSLAADETKPHPHQGKSEKFTSPKPTKLSKAEEKKIMRANQAKEKKALEEAIEAAEKAEAEAKRKAGREARARKRDDELAEFEGTNPPDALSTEPGKPVKLAPAPGRGVAVTPRAKWSIRTKRSIDLIGSVFEQNAKTLETLCLVD